MTVATNRGSSSAAGLFATAPRGGLTPAEITEIRRLRGLNRGWQTIANILGRCREDVMSIEPLNAAAQAVGSPQLRPFVWGDQDQKLAAQLIEKGTSAETLAACFGCSVAEAQRHIRQVVGRRGK